MIKFACFFKFMRVALLMLALCAPAMAQSPQPMIEPHAQAMPLLPFLDFYVDESMSMDIEEAARLTQGWQPLALDRLPAREGIVWLRFTIAPLAPDARPRTFLLDMGQSVPGEPVLYDPVHNELSGAREWRENLPARRNILLLPEAGQEAVPCYIRLEGLPGPWFAPMIRTPQNAASNFGSLAASGAILALAVIMLLCILRGLGERGQWRYWTALFVGVALCQAILGMPRETQHFSAADIAAILCPGLALMFLPHVGRHLMQTRQTSRAIDIQLFLLSLPGAVLAVLPLAPGWDWLDRWLAVWPLGTILFVPTALGAWLMGISGSRRFLLACVLPPLFVAFALLGMEFGLPANILAACPIWAVAFSAMILAATRAPRVAGQEAPEQTGKKPSAAKKRKKEPDLTIAGLDLAIEEPVINLERPLDDPNLRLIPAAPETVAEPEEEPAPRPPRRASAAALEAQEARDMALWQPVDDILRQTAALEQCSLPPTAREAAAGIKAAAQKLGVALSGPENMEAEGSGDNGAEVFNLQRVLRNAHDSVAAIAECSGVALSWYMPPHLPQIYRGDGRALEDALRRLLESAARCCQKGNIKLSARGLPGGSVPGDLLFTVSDDGCGYPPHDRSGLALARAWELTGRHGGYLSVEASSKGATVAFTARFTPVDAEEREEEQKQGVILASDDPGEGRQLARIIEAIPCHVHESSSAAGIIAAQKRSSVALLVAHGRFAKPASGDVVKEFCRLARQNGVAECFALAVTTLDESQWHLLKSSGFTHAMLDPVDPEVLRRTVADLLHLDERDLPSGPFALENSALTKNNAKEEKAPDVLIEPDFPIRAAFEGPEWLGGGRRGEEPKAQPVPKEKQSDAAETTVAAKTVDAALEEPLEWVGEPKPIAKAPQKTEISHAPEDAVEWVGEPVPVQKSVTDFIVAAEARPEARTSGIVKSFMEGSASLVSHTLSGILSKKDESGAPAANPAITPPAEKAAQPCRPAPKPEAALAPQEEPADSQPEALRASSDPEVVALLDRLDEHMRRANGFHKARNTAGVAAAVASMARDAEIFGLRLLTRMAMCVERAARANDLAALNDLLPELEHAVERNRISIIQKQGGKSGI